MSGHVMGRALAWALVWAVSGPGLWSRPLGRLLWAHWISGGFDFAKCIKVVGLNRLLPLVVCIAYMLS